MKKEITLKERQRTLTVGILIILGFSLIGILVTYPMRMEERFLPFSIVLLTGIFCDGVYVSKKLARTYDEFVWGITSFVMLTLIIGEAIYYRHLIGDTSPAFYNIILNVFLIALPTSMAAAFFTFEILQSIKDKKTLTLHVKRFAGRMVLGELCSLLFVTVYSAVNLLNPLFPEDYHIKALVLVTPIPAIILYVMVKNSRIRRLFSILGQ